jgi:methionyl-tRNA synthetase
MAKDTNHFYVTTPIYYVTARPHLGSLYSTVLADVVARWQKLQGKQLFFLAGTDEHGQKIAQAAEKAGKQPKEFVDSFIAAYKEMWHNYEISYDHFVRTTDKEHIEAVYAWIRYVQNKGDIYKSKYEGWYCTHCETYVTEKEAEKGGQKEVLCPSCSRPTNWVSEETYFFRLSAYQDRLLKFYKENPNFVVPKERINEVISFVESGLKDLSISRTTVKWGIQFPDDPAHTVYVWADALNNYISAIGYGQAGREKEFATWWPADLHIMGKDIVRFHAVFWPAFLMAADLEMPKRLLVHGWIKVGDQKMSKSLGNVVDPQLLFEEYGPEPVRYYLVRHLAINQDGAFSIQDLEQIITSDLANDLGNLLNRMLALTEKHGLIQVPKIDMWSANSMELRDACWNMVQDVETFMADYAFHLALARIWKFINQVNAYFHAHEPWKLAATERQKFIEVIAATCHSLRAIAILVWPVMPSKMEQLLATLGHTIPLGTDTIKKLELAGWRQEFVLTKSAPLFEKPAEKEAPEQIPQQTPTKKESKTMSEYIAIDDVAKVNLVVGTVEQAEQVVGSDKLLKLQVNFGALGMRQILSGVGQTYKPDDLVGKQGIFITNLKPRMMMGLESQGMMLFAQDEAGKQRFISVSMVVPNGTAVK